MESEIVMPRVGVNDDYVVLARWLVDEGESVKSGQKIAIVETSKETVPLIAGVSGMLCRCVQEGEEVKVGNKIAIISDKAIRKEIKSDVKHDYKITEKAKALIDKYSVDISRLDKSKIIKESDVRRLLEAMPVKKNISNNQILIYGGGGFGEIAIDILKCKHEYRVYGVIDNNMKIGDQVLGIPVVGHEEELESLYEEGFHTIFNAIGFWHGVHWRKPLYDRLKARGFRFPNIIHPSAIMESSIEIGEGNLICPGAIIESAAEIGNNCIINAGTIISHNCIVKDSCHIASGAVLAGGVMIGENSLIGQNCTINIGVKIGKNVVIQNGCHIFKDIEDNEVVSIRGNI